MGFDAMANDSSVSALSRDFGKKKRTNRSAKLKQCKLDARREQWLSQVKNKACKATSTGTSPTSLPPHPALSLPRTGRKSFEGRSVEEEHRTASERDGSGLHDSDEESPTHSSTAGGELRKECPHNSISSGSSLGSCSRSVSDAEEEERGEEKEGMDDWEAVADALTAVQDQERPNSNPTIAVVTPTATPSVSNVARTGGTGKPEPDRTVSRAWSPDDVFRPQSLPNLSKQHSFPSSRERHFGAAGWARRGVLSVPSSCPICYEDLDLTDSSFLPCSCGFRLCLFCHKRILESDGRCPGCRKQYSPVASGEVGTGGGMPHLASRLSRSCSTNSRS